MTSKKENMEFELPVKRVKGNTPKEKLTDNVYDKILPARYLKKDNGGDVIEEPKEMFRRVAENIAQPEKEYNDYDYEETADKFYKMMSNLEFIPNSPTIMNAGANLQQLSACFVIHPEDDLDSIFSTVHDAAKIFQTGGGAGYPFHLMRPKGDVVKSTGGSSSGPLTFQRVFDQTCKTIKQGGRRRGAQMAVMRVDHPDILRFVVSKRKEGNLPNFNISVGITDEFIEAVKNDEEYTLINPQDDEPHEVTRQTAEFYNQDEEWYPDVSGSDRIKSENFWRDYADSIEGVDDYDIHFEVGDKMTLPARFIWKCIVDGAWRNGEPGLYMYDIANRNHSFDVDKHPEHKIEATNPCVTGDTLINTANGMMRAKELYEQRVATDIVVDGRLDNEKLKEASSIYKTGTKKVYKLKTKEGYELRLTEDHMVMTENGWGEARDLNPGEKVHILNRGGSFGYRGTIEEGRVLGWTVGDGQIKNSEERAVLHFYDRDTELSEQFGGYVNQIIREPEGNGNYTVGAQTIERNVGHRQKLEAKEERVRSARLYEVMEDYGLVEEKLQVPDRVFRGSKDLVRGFLQGLFTADGSVQGNVEKGVSVRLSSSKLKLLKEVQKLLLNFGIYSKIYENRRDEGYRELPDGKGGMKEYKVKAQHDLVISKGDLKTFDGKIGFLREDKNEKLREGLEKYSRGPYSSKFKATVESLESDGREDVFDLTEPQTHSFIANGFVVHNCGEQPLENYESCNLGHINLSLMVKNVSNGKGLNFEEWKKDQDEYNYEDDEELREAMEQFLKEALRLEKFKDTIKTGTRFLDNVIDMNNFPLEEIEEKTTSMRKVGLGLMGFAQMLIQIGIRYGSRESVACAEVLQKLITKYSVEESHKLAKERGKFEKWNESKWNNPMEYPDWFRKFTGGLDPEEHEDGFAMRNHSTTTIAPTGSTSMVANTSGGCEPIFSLAYFKNVASDVQGDEMLVEFDDYFLKALEANDVDVEKVKEEAKELMNNNEWEGIDSISDDVLPPRIKKLFATTNTIKPEEHVRIQAAFQKYNHSGISKTCNFPNDATREDITRAFKLAYDLKVKGLTVYRDGSRDVQVMTTRKENKLEGKEDLLDALLEKYDSLEDMLRSREFEKIVDLEKNTSLTVRKTESGDLTVSKVTTGERKERERRDRPDIINGTTQKIETGQGSMFVTINEDSEGLFEVFVSIGKSGGFTSSFTEAVGRLISLALRSGIDPKQIIDELKGIRSPKMAWDKGTKIHSIPDGIAKAMERYLKGEARDVQESVKSFSQDEEGGKTDGGEKQIKKMIERGINPECPDCGSVLEYTEGCIKCPSCGWSEC